MVLKLAGEYADKPPAEITAARVISPSVDGASTDAIVKDRIGCITRILFQPEKRIRLKKQLYPDLYDVENTQTD